MQSPPRISVVDIEHEGQNIKALRVSPVVVPPQKTWKNGSGVMVDLNPPNMPRVPVDYLLTDADEAQILGAFFAQRQVSDYSVFKGLDYDPAKARATVARINTKMDKLGLGTAIVVDEVGRADSLSFTLRHKAEVWGELDSAYAWREGRTVAQPKAAARRDQAQDLPDIDLPRIVKGRERIARQEPALGQTWRPERVSKKKKVVSKAARKAAARAARPGWMNAEPLPSPDAKTVFTLPNVTLVDGPGQSKVLCIHSDASHVQDARTIALTITDPVHQQLLDALLKNPRGCIAGEDMPSRLPLGTVSAFVQMMNGALAEAESGVRIYRKSTTHRDHDDNNDRMSLRFDARKWGPVPADMAVRGSQDSPFGQADVPRQLRHVTVTQRPVKLTADKFNYPNMPELRYRRESEFGHAFVDIQPKPHHQGKQPMTLELRNDIEEWLMRGVMEKHAGGPVGGMFKNAPVRSQILQAAHSLNQRLEQMGAGMHIHVYEASHSQRALLRYDMDVWGEVPLRFASRRSMSAEQRRGKPGYQFSLGLIGGGNRALRRQRAAQNQPGLFDDVAQSADAGSDDQQLTFNLRPFCERPAREPKARMVYTPPPPLLEIMLDPTARRLQVGMVTLPLDDTQVAVLRQVTSPARKSTKWVAADAGLGDDVGQVVDVLRRFNDAMPTDARGKRPKLFVAKRNEVALASGVSLQITGQPAAPC